MYYFSFGCVFLFISFYILVSKINPSKILEQELKNKNNEQDSTFLKGFLNFSVLMIFWPLVSFLIVLFAYLVSIGKIEDD